VCELACKPHRISLANESLIALSQTPERDFALLAAKSRPPRFIAFFLKCCFSILTSYT
jgi:hypothetical protein